MKDVYIIAEIGINHNGSRALALDLVKMAAECGCNAVKFQKRDIWTVYDQEFLASPRQSPWGDTQLDQKAGLELDRSDFVAIRDTARSLNLDFFASAWDLQSLVFLEDLKPKHHKIASALITHYEFCEEVAKLGRHTFISTGMCEMAHISHIVKVFRRYKCDFTLMHCVSQYPCEPRNANLGMIRTLKREFDCPVGYSDHTVAVWVPPVAVSLGAEAIEVHITLDRMMYGSDQAASFERGGLERVVLWSRDVHGVLGDGKKCILPVEMDVAKKLRYWHAER